MITQDYFVVAMEEKRNPERLNILLLNKLVGWKARQVNFFFSFFFFFSITLSKNQDHTIGIILLMVIGANKLIT